MSEPEHTQNRKAAPIYFGTQGAAEYLNRSAGAVRNLVLRRAIPFRKPGGRLVFIKSELDGWIETAPGLRLADIQELTS
jgi:excisionase family DNA binding protein